MKKYITYTIYNKPKYLIISVCILYIIYMIKQKNVIFAESKHMFDCEPKNPYGDIQLGVCFVIALGICLILSKYSPD